MRLRENDIHWIGNRKSAGPFNANVYFLRHSFSTITVLISFYYLPFEIDFEKPFIKRTVKLFSI